MSLSLNSLGKLRSLASSSAVELPAGSLPPVACAAIDSGNFTFHPILGQDISEDRFAFRFLLRRLDVCCVANLLPVTFSVYLPNLDQVRQFERLTKSVYEHCVNTRCNFNSFILHVCARQGPGPFLPHFFARVQIISTSLRKSAIRTRGADSAYTLAWHAFASS